MQWEEALGFGFRLDSVARGSQGQESPFPMDLSLLQDTHPELLLRVPETPQQDATPPWC